MNQLHFIESPALWSLGLLILVIILYLLRMPRTRMVMASLLFLKEARLDSQRQKRRMLTFVSLLLQVLILALLAFSAARPLWSSGELAEKRWVLVVDISASMRAADGKNGAMRFADAKEAARTVIRKMEHGDRMLIVAVDNQARIVQQFEKDRRTLYRAVAALEPGFFSTRLNKGLELVEEVTRPIADPRVYIITDGADKIDAERFKDLLSKIKILLVGKTKENIGITSFSSRRNMDSERDFSTLLMIQNTFKAPRKVSLKLSIGKTVVDFREITLAPGNIHAESFEQTLLVGGLFKAEVSVSTNENVTDVFPIDNTAWEWIPQRERLKVLVVAPEDELGGYLDAAMSANIGVAGYRITPDKYNVNFDVDAMIFYNWTPDELPNCHVIFVNTRGENPAAQVSTETVMQPMIRSWDRTHPLMNYIGLENLLLSEVLNVKGAAFMEQVVRTVQAPIVLAGQRGAQKMVFVAFDPRKSDFPFRLAFPVLISNSLLWFTEEEVAAEQTQIQPGEVYEIRIPRYIKQAPGTITVADPLKHEIPVNVAENRTALFADTYLCGVYTYEIDGKTYGFSVNLANPEESDLGARAEFQKPGAGSKETGRLFLERELWFLLNWIALVLLCVESYVYHQRIVF